MNALEKRIIDISYKHGLSHVSSCLNTVNVLDSIYGYRLEHEPVVLGNAHAGLALYVVLEKYGLCDAEDMLERHGIHSTRDIKRGVWVSGGSLGQPETIAVGMALADTSRKVHLVTSDGACSEGAVWESFSLASELCLSNLEVHVIANGYGAYKTINVDWLKERLAAFLKGVPFTVYQPEMQYEWLEGLKGHYVVMSKSQYEEATHDV